MLSEGGEKRLEEAYLLLRLLPGLYCPLSRLSSKRLW
jgi:hypothetical protein